MRILVGLLFLMTTAFTLSNSDWGHNYKEALEAAKKEHKLILINFSGSDWCGPCIRLHKEVFVMEDFVKIANEHLVLVNADFPRYKKNQLTAAQQKLNDELADKYNSKGLFPYTVLVDENGNLLKDWEGFPASPSEFIEDIQQVIKEDHH
jgi:thioredoxin-related protein